MNISEYLEWVKKQKKVKRRKWSRSHAPKAQGGHKPPVPKPRKPAPRFRAELIRRAKKARPRTNLSPTEEQNELE